MFAFTFNLKLPYIHPTAQVVMNERTFANRGLLLFNIYTAIIVLKGVF